MMKKFLSFLMKRMFSSCSARKLALAATLGTLAGILPSFPVKLPILLLLSMLGGLNLFCMLTGMMLAMIFPILSLPAVWLNNRLAGLSVWALNLAFRRHWAPFIKASLLSSILSGALLCAATFLLLWLLFHLLLGRRPPMADRHVFCDPAGIRMPVVQVFLTAAACISILILSLTAISVNASPVLPKYRFSSAISGINSLPRAFSIRSLTARDRYYARHTRFSRRSGSSSASRQVYAFYVSWDGASRKSLRQHLSVIDTVVTDWYTLDNTGKLVTHDDTGVDGEISAAHRREQPLVSNYVGSQWNAAVLHRLLTNPQTENAFFSAALSDISAHHYSGLNVDFENLSTADSQSYVSFLSKLYAVFHRRGLSVSLDVPAEDSAYPKAALLKNCDKMIVMLYDEHNAGGTPGSVASGAWTAHVLSDPLLHSSKVIAGLGSYGLDWTLGSGDAAESLSFADTMNLCGENHLQVAWDSTTQTPYFTYRENGNDHVVWFLDGATLYNAVQQADAAGTGGVALWRLGTEDDTAWSILRNLNHPNPRTVLQALSTIRTALAVNYVGNGELLRVSGGGQYGSRTDTLARSGFITNEVYTSYPSEYTVQKFGGTTKKEVALTFDDGPDPYYTPKVLKILEQSGVKASFFLIGENAENAPELVEREYLDGDDIGNHTFTHPNIVHISPARTNRELTATQRLIEEITGHSTILFRAPYNADSEPDTLEELVPVLRAQQLGYLMVGESIDPLDWQSPPKDVIISRVLNGLPNGNVVLLHDGGGVRDQTLAALPELITRLKQKGYTFVTVNQLLHESRNQVMPATGANDIYLSYDHAFFQFMYVAHTAVQYIFYLTVTLGIFRLLFLSLLSARQRRRYHKRADRLPDGFSPLVSVLIPCYNEKAVICGTISSVLSSRYASFEVIVVDDGSSDDSLELVQNTFRSDPRVHCLRQKNGGKSSALNRGLQQAHGEIVIAIDADTLFDPDAIRLMVRYFTDPLIAAVSGNVKVGNRGKIVTEWQHAEYVTGFNLERRAYSELNCITVVPGAIGAWRRDILMRQGGFRSDTLAEDTDMTLSLLEQGYHIAFEERAKAYTETPETFRSLLKQRFRWTYGTLQCLWKHRSALFCRRQKTLGFIAMPFMWIFQYLFQTFCPIVDLYLVLSLLTGNASPKVLFSYLLFLVVDTVSSLFAFHLERENLLPVLWMPIQRLVYRFMMAYIVLKSIYTAILGKTVGWNKLKRTGNATAGQP